MTERHHFIGLISGTSMDGIDTALISTESGRPEFIHGLSYDYPVKVLDQLKTIIAEPDRVGLRQLGELDTELGQCFASAAEALIQQSGIDHNQIVAIGSHGQNIYHHAIGDHPFTLQIGNPHVIATQTGIDTIADFRRADVAAGGQGAPLAPLFHQQVFGSDQETVAALNLGGIANITVLPASSDTPVLGFDTGPANCLMDEWIARNRGQRYDDKGDWAASENYSTELLDRLLDDPYFQAEPPKSTGREYFHLNWLRQKATLDDYSAGCVQATLAELTARTVADAINKHAPDCNQVFVCGGGAYNRYLMNRIQSALPNTSLKPSSEAGIAPDWIEASLFAWLAQQHLAGNKMDTRSITGAAQRVLLGVLFRAAL